MEEDSNKKAVYGIYITPLIIVPLYCLLMIIWLFTWRELDGYSLIGLLFAIIWMDFPIWGTIGLTIILPLAIHFEAKHKRSCAEAIGLSPNSPEVTEIRKTEAASLAVGTVAAGFAAKAVNDKIKKESQVKKNF